MLEFNIAPNTQIGRIVIPEKVYNHENTYMMDEEKYSRSGEFIENMVTDNHIEYCHRWFGLAGIEEFIEDIDEYYGDRFGKFSNFQKAGFRSPIQYKSDNIETPISFTNSKVMSPIIIKSKRPENLNYDELMKEVSI